LLPKSLKDIGFVPATFTPAQLQAADDEAWRVIQAVAAGQYEPISTTPVAYDDFARICQVGAQSAVPPKPERIAHDNRTSAVALKTAPTRVVAQAQKRLADDQYVAQRTSVAPNLPPLMIRASAGTGKTYQLSNRLLQIILSGQSVDHVLATTFTRKAAGEILQRVLVRLAKACLDAKAFSDLQLAIPALPFDQADCLAALRRVTRQLHRFRVSTLDSFYAQIARTFSLELHLAPGWSAIDPVREAAVRMQAIQRMLDHSDQKTLNSLVKMLAKGDTKRSVAAEIEDTVQGAYHYYRAANEAAFNNLSVPASPPEEDFREALEFLQRFDPQHKSIKNAQENLSRLALIGDWEEVVSQGLMKAAVETGRYYNRELSPKLLDRLALLRRKCAAELLPIRRAQTTAAYELLDSFNSQYMALLRRQRMLAFADITYLLSRWMNPQSAKSANTPALPTSAGNMQAGTTQTGSAQTGPAQTGSARTGSALPMIEIDQQQLMLRMDCGIDHLLLDEFQDTAPDQWRIIEPLATPLTTEITPKQSFFCVGDTKQAIYGWRGGVAEIFDTVTQSVANLTEQSLSESYRSSPAVIDVVNAVFQYLPRHENFADCNEVAVDWSNHFPEHRTTRQDLPGYVLVKNGIICEADLPREEQDMAELEYSAQMIGELAAQAPHRSIGVLFRENRKVAMMIELLRKRGVSASQEGGNPLTDSAAVQLILSLVHLADHPGDSIAAFHVHNSPLINLLPQNVRDQTGRLAAWLWQQVTTLGLGSAISNICDLIAPQLSWWEQHRLTQLITLAYQFEVQFTHRLRDFELFVQQQKVALPSEAQVKVMTIHSSKGLEFDAVFLPDLGIPLAGHPPLMVTRASDPCLPPEGVLRYMNEQVQSLLPAEWRQAFHDRKAQSVREILCVLYVAMTRARSALYMITAPRVSRQQNATQQCESVLQSVLGDAQLFKTAEAVLYEHGDAQWFADGTQSPVIQIEPFQIEPFQTEPFQTEPIQIEPMDSEVLEPVGAQRRQIALQTDADTAPRRGYRVAAPSSIAAMSSIELGRLFTVSESIGAAIGTLVHACFEQVVWLDGSTENLEPASVGNLPSQDRLRETALNALTPEELRHLSLDKELANFRRMLKLESVQNALSRSRYARPVAGVIPDEISVENERRVSLILDHHLIDGSIDRLVVLKHQGQIIAAEILDYKTDRWDPRMDIDLWTRQRIEHHKPQLNAYAQVVSRMLKLPLER
ncbi:MAG: UvrD-helicase domain-containing protein, partial [Pirellulaceae bacterium]|nr:UvrD-helicase domain-containing protein [Pirellulaceae bacterium]